MKKIAALTLCFLMLIASACSSNGTGTAKNTAKPEESVIDGGKQENGSEPGATVAVIDLPALSTGGNVTFTAYDRNGTAYDESIFAQYELTMINFWEPWCGPCVGEIPDLEKIYEEYSDKGLLIIGVYSEDTMEDEVDEILSSSGVTYPVLRYDSAFDKYLTGYVPTTIFVDRNGNIIDTGITYQDIDGTTLVGSRTFDEWEELVRKYLGI